MNDEILSFVVYIIHELSESWNIKPSKVYSILMQTECIEKYLVPFYDVLHTQGTSYIVNDIKEYVAKRGVTVA